MEFLPISFETILNILNKNKNKLNFDDIFFQIKNNPNYKILIEGKGQCADFAMTACFLAETIGLNCAITGTGNHAIYLIQVDDKVYSGSNQVLSLGSPTNEIIYSRWSDKTELSN